MISTRDALSGPWAANIQGWLWISLFATVVVVTQELATPFPDIGWTVVSAVDQLIVATAWGAAVAGISRRLFGRVVPIASGLLWLGLGVARGVTGGLVAASAGLDPEWLYRIGFWTVVSLCWMPLLTYAFAQWDEHRRLLGVRANLAAASDDVTARSTESAGDRARRIAAAVDDGLGPALEEIRASLRENAARLDSHAVRAIGSRLDALASRAANFVAPPALPAVLPGRRVSIAAASREFELGRPIFAALLTAANTAPLVLPDAFRDGGLPQVAEAVVAIAVSTLALMAMFTWLSPLRFTGRQRSVLSAFGVFAAGIVGAAVLVLLAWHPFHPYDLVLIAVFPLIVATAASATATAVALNATNVELSERADEDQHALDEITTGVEIAEAEASSRLETLVRGEVNGRLASCAMALAFLASGGVPTESRDEVLAGVLAQLDAASADLHQSSR